MALQSQMLRTPVGTRSSGNVSFSRRSSGKKLVGVAMLLAIVGGSAYVLFGMRKGANPLAGPQTAQANTDLPRAALPGTQPVANTSPNMHIGPSVDPLQAPAASAPTTPAPAARQPSSPTVLEMSNGKRAGRGDSSQTLIPSTTLPTETTTSVSQATQTPSPTAPSQTTPAPTAPTSQPNTMPPLPGTTGTPTSPAAPASATPPTSAPAPTTSSSSGFGSIPADLAPVFANAERAQAQNKLLEARTNLNTILLDPRTSAKDREGLRAWISRLNGDLVFSPTVFPGDALVETYKVSSGDNLARIAKKTGAVTEPALLARVNRLTNPNALQVGQSLKIVRGPFHVVVSKSAFRMDVYAGPVPSASALGERGLPDGAEPGWTYITSYPVGLGKDSGTPIANFIVKENKLINPTWANPRTGEKFAADDPKNPIGERWIGLAGLDEKSKGFEKYGIHGTVEAESIGAEMSMGCVRMRAADVEVVYELLMPRVSVVKIVP